MPGVKYDYNSPAGLFKETYSDISRNHYNSDTVLLARTKKRYDLQGIKDHIAIPVGMAGGVGGAVGGSLPVGGQEGVIQIEVTAKDVYGRAVVTRKAMKASATDRGAFVRLTKRPVEKCVERYDNWVNLLMHQDATGRITKTKSSSAYISGGATAPVIELDSAEWFPRWIQENDIIEIGNAGDTSTEDGLFIITSVDETNKRITLSRYSGSFDLSSGTNANARWIYMQRSFKAMPNGFETTIMATSGTIYGQPYSRQWSSYHYDASSSPISIPMINYALNQQITRVGKGNGPNLIITSPEIWAHLADKHENLKRYTLEPRSKELQGNAKFSFSGLSLDTPDGKTIGIFPDRHCKPNRMYLLNDEYLYLYHMPDQGWFDEDGKVFLRVADKDEYEARYGGYFEFVCHPTFQAVIKNLATNVA